MLILVLLVLRKTRLPKLGEDREGEIVGKGEGEDGCCFRNHSRKDPHSVILSNYRFLLSYTEVLVHGSLRTLEKPQSLPPVWTPMYVCQTSFYFRL